MRQTHIAVRIRGFLERTWNSTTVENTFWVTAAAALSALLGAVGSALYARYLGVEEFGVLALIVSLVTMMVALADLGISGSIVRFASEAIARKDHNRLRAAVNISLKAKLLLSGCVLAGALLLLSPIVTAVFKHVDARITSYFLLSLIAAAGGMAAAFFPPLYQSFRKFRTLAFVSVGSLALKIIVLAGVALFLSLLTLSVAIWIEISGAVVLLLASYRLSPYRNFRLTADDKDLRRQMLSFNKWLSLYYVLNLLAGRIDLFFVGGLTDARSLGLYGAAMKVASMVIIITGSYLTVLLPELSSALTGEMVKRKQRNSFMIVAVFAVGIGLLALLADLLVLLVFGGAFDGAGDMLRVMCIGLLFTVLAYPLNATLFAWNKSEVYPLMTGVGIVALVLGNVVLIPRYGALGAAMAFSIAGLVGFLVSTVIYFIHLRKRTG